MEDQQDYETEASGLFDGRLKLFQPRRGYRFSADAPLLVWFAHACEGRMSSCADVGAGCGVIGIGLLGTERVRLVTAFERQERLADLASRNARENDMSSRFRLIHADVRHAASDPAVRGQFDLVVSNPPFWPAFENRTPADVERLYACHEAEHSLDEWIHACALLTSERRGRLCIIFPTRRLDELLSALHTEKMSATRLQLVFGSPNRQAELVLVEARRGSLGRIAAPPPLFLKAVDGSDTPLAAAVMSGAFSDQLRARADWRC